MTASESNVRIPQEVLAEQYFGFMHKLIALLQDRFRSTSGLTQKKMGERIGKQPAVVSRSLSGQENLTVRSMHDLARAMDCRLEVNLVPLDTVQPTNRPMRRAQSLHSTTSGSSTAEVHTFAENSVTTANGASIEMFSND